MIRRILSLVFIATVISSCGNSGKKDITSKTEGEETALKVEFASLVENPDNYINKNIIVEGKVVHVCTESGKKMFIVGENPDVRLYVAAGENMSKFPMELLGSQISVEGIITKTGVPEVAMGEGKEGKENGEGMHAMAGAGKPEMSDSCETETALTSQPSLANIIMEYKSHTVK